MMKKLLIAGQFTGNRLHPTTTPVSLVPKAMLYRLGVANVSVAADRSLSFAKAAIKSIYGMAARHKVSTVRINKFAASVNAVARFHRPVRLPLHTQIIIDNLNKEPLQALDSPLVTLLKNQAKQ